MAIHKLKKYDDPVLDRQIEELCAEMRRIKTGLPTYVDNAAAIAGGLAAGKLYRTSAGDLRIVYTP